MNCFILTVYFIDWRLQKIAIIRNIAIGIIHISQPIPRPQNQELFCIIISFLRIIDGLKTGYTKNLQSNDLTKSTYLLVNFFTSYAKLMPVCKKPTGTLERPLINLNKVYLILCQIWKTANAEGHTYLFNFKMKLNTYK